MEASINKILRDYNVSFDELTDWVVEQYSGRRMQRLQRKWDAFWDFSSDDWEFTLAFHRGCIMDGKRNFDTSTDEKREKNLRKQFRDIIRLSILEDDYLPSFIADDRPQVQAAAFGCKVEFVDGVAWCHKAINQASDVYRLKRPDLPDDAPWIKQVLEFSAYVVDKTCGEIPLHICDMSGPLATAQMIWGAEQFMFAMYDHPQEVHHLLDMTTDLFIEFTKLQIKSAGQTLIPYHTLPYGYMPPGSGVTISEDIIALVSPELYQEYCCPYHERIADAFGHVFVHSCGHAIHAMEAVAKTKGCWGLQFGQMQLDEVLPHSPAKDFVIASGNDWESHDQLFRAIDCAKKHGKRVVFTVQEIEREKDMESEQRGKYDYDEQKILRLNEAIKERL